MDDKFLHDARREPDPAFARDLRERLARESPPADAPRARPALRPGPVVWAAAGALVVAALFLIPAVRATAQGFLDLFRVRNFAAVTVDPARLEQLRGSEIDLKSILGTPQVVHDPGPMQVFPDAASAAGAAGYALRMPTDVPGAMQADTIRVHGETEESVRVDTARLRSLLSSLAIDDLEVPPALEGADVRIRVPPVAIASYRHDQSQVMFLQAPSPEVTLPAGVELARLGEIGLRVAGLAREDARRFARSVDWHSTMLVPVPATVGSFREVDVRGQKGLLVAWGTDGGDRPRRRVPHSGSQLMWAADGRVYALMSNTVSDLDLLRMANSVQ
ncbi:MAG: hypothetical protein ABI960_04120 [Candidatus Eisenbacteria bacterium]